MQGFGKTAAGAVSVVTLKAVFSAVGGGPLSCSISLIGGGAGARKR